MSENIDIITRKENIVAIADAVRAKKGTTAEMTLGEIVSGIEGIEAGGGSGASVETCTVTVDCTNLFACHVDTIFYSSPNGGISGVGCQAGSSITIQNVLCNSVIVFLWSDSEYYYMTSEEAEGFEAIMVNGVSIWFSQHIFNKFDSKQHNENNLLRR